MSPKTSDFKAFIIRYKRAGILAALTVVVAGLATIGVAGYQLVTFAKNNAIHQVEDVRQIVLPINPVPAGNMEGIVCTNWILRG